MTHRFDLFLAIAFIELLNDFGERKNEKNYCNFHIAGSGSSTSSLRWR
jgi:hypothetical protein